MLIFVLALHYKWMKNLIFIKVVLKTKINLEEDASIVVQYMECGLWSCYMFYW